MPESRFPSRSSDRLIRYAISDASGCHRFTGASYIRALLQSSADVVQWREPSIDRRTQLRWLREALSGRREAGVPLIVNSDLELALEAGAAGVHYKARQAGDYERAKQGGLVVGRSIHSLQEGRAAWEAGCDYVLLSPLFAPRSKSSSLPPLLSRGACRVAAELPVPVIALGGVSSEHWEALRHCEELAGLAGISWVHSELEAQAGDGAERPRGSL